MPSIYEQQHRWLGNPAIPFATYVSPIDETPHYIQGLNTMTTLKGVLERRPGFAGPVESKVTTFAGRIASIYSWRRWNGSNFLMVNEITATNSNVYKLEIGRDASFIQLFTIANTAPFGFHFQNDCCFMGNGQQGSMQVYNGTALYTWGIQGPSNIPVCNIVPVASGINCETDYHYRYTYWDANAAHESSPSDVNDCIGLFTNSGINISVFASPNPRVTHIRIYRTTDGGSTDPQQMQELPTSPIPNVSATVTDYANDADLRDNFAPGLKINDPPPPLQGFQSNGSRIYGFTGNQVWFSAFDESTNGVQEECWPSGIGGNYYPFQSEIGALEAKAGQDAMMAVFMPSNVYGISGELRNDLDRGQVDNVSGARFPHNTTSYGSDVGWFDVSNQVKSSVNGELSLPIRDIMQLLDPANVQIEVYQGNSHKWLCVLDGLSGTLYVFDIDMSMWQTPWPIGASAIHAGEISPGKRVLYASVENEIWYQTEGQYTDAGDAYPARIRTGLIPLAPLRTTSPMLNMLTTNVNPAMVQDIDAVVIERSSDQAPSDVRINLGEDAMLDTAFFSIIANEGDPTDRKSGTKLVTRRYTIETDSSIAERCSVDIEWDALPTNFKLYSIDVEIHPEATVQQ